MPWFAITTIPSQMEKLCSSIKILLPSSVMFSVPAKKMLGQSIDKGTGQVPLVFINTESEKQIVSIIPILKLKYKLKCTLMYDRVRDKKLIIPDNQMELFRRNNPYIVDEIVVLAKPFTEYAEKNIRFHILDGPFKGMEGYKIDLHREKKLAVSFGNLTVALNNLYKYKVCRVVEIDKDPLFKQQQLQRIFYNVIGSLKMAGFVDKNYSVFRHLISACVENEFDIALLANNMSNYYDGDKDRILKEYIKNIDAITAGHLVTLARNFNNEGLMKPIIDEFRQKEMPPFMTPPYGLMCSLQSHFKIEHKEGFYEIIHVVELTERVPAEKFDHSLKIVSSSKSEYKKTAYFAHVKVEKVEKDNTEFYSDFSSFFKLLSSMPRERKNIELDRLLNAKSPLMEVIQCNDSEGIRLTEKGLTITVNEKMEAINELVIYECAKKISNKGIAIVNHLLHTSRLAIWRNLLPTVIIHS